jgi:cobyrinic acid a,c-diamide synthase
MRDVEARRLAAPRVMIGALRGGSGKTLLSTGLVAAARARGLTVAAFKKGPDYIDPAWLTRATGGVPCRNLDPHLMTEATLLGSVGRWGASADLILIEGNHGLLDGLGASGAGSTAALAALLRTPIVLVVDCTRATRTIAAMVLGCQRFDGGLDIAGVILNRVGTKRQETAIRAAIAEACGVPVVGAIPRLPDLDLPERHLGLLTPAEHPDPDAVIARGARLVEGHVDLDAVRAIARQAPALEYVEDENVAHVTVDPGAVRIGVARDRAFSFYYPENLEALERLGATIVWIDTLRDTTLPSIDALYIGGGYPETHARALAANRALRTTLRWHITAGLPVIAECGGLIYLAEAYHVAGVAHPMVGVFPVDFALGDRPAGHGYTSVTVDGPNAFFPRGTALRGHEFRYSRPHVADERSLAFAFRMARGYGFDGERDGLVSGNVLASFCHFHAGAAPEWAAGVVRAARAYRAETADSRWQLQEEHR